MKNVLGLVALSMISIALTGCPPESPTTEDSNAPAADGGEPSVLDEIEPESQFIEPEVDGESNIIGEPAEDSLEDSAFEGVAPDIKDPPITNPEPADAPEDVEPPQNPPKNDGGDLQLTAPENPKKTPPKDGGNNEGTVGDAPNE